MMDEGEPVLKHDIRRMIYNHIVAHPGVSFNILKTVFGLNDSTLRYHLDYLEKAGKISFGSERGKRHYYPHPGKTIVFRMEEEMPKAYELTITQEQIVNTIKRYPRITQKELCRLTGIKRLTLTNNLRKLMELCLVRKIPNQTNVCYECIENDQLRFEILKRLAIKLLKKEITEEQFLELKRKLEK